jgi:hypothetical protein
MEQLNQHKWLDVDITDDFVVIAQPVEKLDLRSALRQALEAERFDELDAGGWVPLVTPTDAQNLIEHEPEALAAERNALAVKDADAIFNSVVPSRLHGGYSPSARRISTEVLTRLMLDQFEALDDSLVVAGVVRVQVVIAATRATTLPISSGQSREFCSHESGAL